MRIEGGSQGGDNLEILGGVQSVFFNSQRGDNFFLPWGDQTPTPVSRGGSVPPVPPQNNVWPKYLSKKNSIKHAAEKNKGWGNIDHGYLKKKIHIYISSFLCV